jgi:hypothetical protein
MNKNFKYYRFINSETGNVIYYLSCPNDEKEQEQILETTRQKLAYEKGMYIEKIYYSRSNEYESED